MNKKNQPAGFTLVEVITTLIISLLLVSVLAATFLVNQKTFRKSNLKSELAQNGRVALDLMSREVRQAKNLTASLPAESAQAVHELEFEDGHTSGRLQYIRYYLSGTSLMRQIKVYFFAADETTYVHYNDQNAFGLPLFSTLEDRIIGENFSGIDFYGINYINIDLHLEKGGENLSIKSIITPRNL